MRKKTESEPQTSNDIRPDIPADCIKMHPDWSFISRITREGDELILAINPEDKRDMQTWLVKHNPLSGEITSIVSNGSAKMFGGSRSHT